MKKTVVLSTNDDPNYLSYLPYVQEAWNKLGWETLTFYLGDNKEITTCQGNNFIIRIQPIEGYKDCTIVQVARLFAAKFVEGLIMTGDVDMIPLSNYWKPDKNKITCYGIDLTGDNQIPMCYVAANNENWNKIIPENNIAELLAKYPKAKSLDFQDYWFQDQRILTERIGNFAVNNNEMVLRKDRGFNGNLAKGRIDRADWENSFNQMPLIDAHMIRPFDLEQTLRVMKLITI